MTTTRFDTLDDLVQHVMEQQHIPGAAVGILHDGQVETHAYGVVSLSSNYPTQPDTLFQIGSQTKVFTATLAMLLVEQGKLALDTPIREYLPDLRLADEQALAHITLRHLLTHTSGLEGDRFEDLGVGDDALAKYVDQAYTWGQETDPGELWSYCNSGFGLVGRVIEAVTGGVYEQVVRERIFEPLDMRRTFLFARDAIVHSAAAGHTTPKGQDQPQVAVPYEIPRCSNPAGGVISCVEDMLTWFRFHMHDGLSASGNQVVKPETLRAMRQRQLSVITTPGATRDMGIGWSLQTIGDTLLIQHGGGTNGHISQGAVVPEQGFAISILTNSEKGGALCQQVQEWALQRYCDLATPKPQPIELPREQLNRLTGTYTRPLGSIRISLEDDRLVATTVFKRWTTGEEETEPPIRLAPINEWEVMLTDGNMAGSTAQFIPNAQGTTPRFLRFGGRLARRSE